MAATPEPSPLTVRTLEASDAPAARAVITKAFAGEPFAFTMYGPSAMRRFAGFQPTFESWPRDDTTIAVVATIGDAVVGVAGGAPPGACMVCSTTPDPPAPDAPESEWIDHEFFLACQRAHHDAQLPPHIRVGPVAVDPFLHGEGIGHAVMRELLDQLCAIDSSCIVLECLTSREHFYASLGFRRLFDFDDPGGPDLRSVLMRFDPAGR